MTDSDDFQSLTALVSEFAAEREWSQFHDPKNLAMALVSEAGELAALFRWVQNSHSDDFARSGDKRAAATEEVGDIGILLLLLCKRIDVSLDEAILQKLEINRIKYPIERSKGKADAPGETK